MARALADHGCAVVTCARTGSEAEQSAAEIEAAGGRAAATTVDVTDRASCEALIAFAVERFGDLHVLVNNAGTDFIQPAAEYRVEDWEAILDVNLGGYFHCAQLAARHMLANGGGSIVMNSSIASTVGIHGLLGYGAAKGAINQLVRTMAVEWAQQGVRVNAIAPGYMENIMATAGEEHARAETYKYAAAGVNLGGGKAVIIGDPKRDKSEALMRAMGRMIDQLGGEYITGEDVGTTLEDMETLYSETDYVVTLPEHCGGAGDISPATALGSIEAMRACAERVWGSPDLAGRTVALQGLGMVGGKALRMLVDAGADVRVTDVDDEKVAAAVAEHGVTAVAPKDIYAQEVDIFAPYALGAVINDETIPLLRAKVVAGAANNILASDRHGDELIARDIVFAVDYIANSGGTIFDTDRYRKGGFQPERAMANLRRLGDRMREVFAIADRDRIAYHRAADRLAEQRIEALNQGRLPRP